MSELGCPPPRPDTWIDWSKVVAVQPFDFSAAGYWSTLLLFSGGATMALPWMRYEDALNAVKQTAEQQAMWRFHRMEGA